MLLKNLIVIIWVLNTTLAARVLTVKLDHLSIKDGLVGSKVASILQDHQGFIWIGTHSGSLHRYDGYNFKLFNHNPDDVSTISSNRIMIIYEDRYGTLWIGTEGGGLNGLNACDGTFTHIKFTDSQGNNLDLEHSTITGILQDPTGILWLAVYGKGLIKYNLATGISQLISHNPKVKNSLSNNDIRALHLDKESFLWIGTEGGGLNRFDPESNTCINYKHDPKNSESISHNDIRAIIGDQGGNLWIGTWNGLDKFNIKEGKFTHYYHDKSNPDSLSHNSVIALFQDSQNRLWVGTYRGGVNLMENINEGIFTRYMNESNNPHLNFPKHVLVITEDKGGLIWIGTSNGIWLYNQRKQHFKHICKFNQDLKGLTGNDIFTIHEDRNGSLWIGTECGGLNCYNPHNGTIRSFRHNKDDPTSISDDNVMGIFEDSEGLLWIGTWGQGLNRFDRNQQRFFRYQYTPEKPGSLSSKYILCINEDPYGNILIGTWKGGLNVLNKKTDTFLVFANNRNNPEGLFDHSVNFILPDLRDSTQFWMGTTNSGLVLYDSKSKTFKNYHQIQETKAFFDGTNIMSLHISPKERNVIWIGTSGRGLIAYNHKSNEIKRYTENDGLPNNQIYGILEDKEGNLWLSTNKGLAKFNHKKGTVIVYTELDGLQSNEFNQQAFCRCRDGKFYFGGINGLSIFYPERIADNNYIPPILLTKFHISNKPFHQDVPLYDLDKIQLSYKDYFSFEFAALDFTNPIKNKYAYMMVGLDDDWILTDSKKRSAAYYKIPPGKYTFKVKGTNSDGIWNETGKQLKIIIIPPFWQTWWFKMCLIFIGLFLIYIWHKTRMERMAHRIKTRAALDRFFDKYNISDREQEIIKLILEGKSNRNIEEKLYISPHTVKNHVYNIYQKLNINNRGQLINLFRDSQRLN
jgi:ligand-binding sensor domain-containing protein/DNA-binding CsgD family transcriptional regulator